MPEREPSWDQLHALLIKARHALTNSPGWQDDDEVCTLVRHIDLNFIGTDYPLPDAARGAYDDGT